MRIDLRQSFISVLSATGIFLAVNACSSDQQELEDPIEFEEGNVIEEGNGFAEGNVAEGNIPADNQFNNIGNNQFSNVGNDQFNNIGNDQFNNIGNDQFNNIGNDQFSNIGNDQFNNFGNDQFANGTDNQFNNLSNNQLANGSDPFLNNAGQGDLEEIIDEINNVPVEESNVIAENQNVVPVPLNVNQANNLTNVVDNIADSASGAFTPVGQALAPGLPEIGSKMSYVVEKGDTLVKIATRIYGDPKRWTEIASFTGLANPRLIYPGDVVYYQLTEQSLAFAAAYENVQRSEVEVLQGDTLSSIAGRVLGNPVNWKLIWRQNDNIDNPDQLVAGTKLFYISPGILSASIDSFKKAFDSDFAEKWADLGKTKSNLEDIIDTASVLTEGSDSLESNDTVQSVNVIAHKSEMMSVNFNNQLIS